ncbi:Bor family protein [Mucilaginibacter sp. UR6-1]|uniref:Bor family protein n=1 Tax=Mucilaginibacter sp. UR6-1 TaxID=1435643 RepID=UPI001E56B963|nr:Bor family protein [Mucilaginibacter sp. UR6-1]MCC8410345.1 Bor family protein [Mucilaginibacter sp. UR6-1]
MKKLITLSLGFAFMSLTFTSCYVNTFNVGKGAQSNVKVSKWNHYIFWGLAPAGVSNPKELAGDATDYTVTIKHSFVNGLLNAITLGIYSPTTTEVTK